MDAYKHSIIMAFGLFLILFGSAASAFAFSYENCYAGGSGFGGGFKQARITQTEYTPTYILTKNTPFLGGFLNTQSNAIPQTNNAKIENNYLGVD